MTYQGKHNGSALLTNERYMEQLEQTQILPMTKCIGEQQKLPQILSKAKKIHSLHALFA